MQSINEIEDNTDLDSHSIISIEEATINDLNEILVINDTQEHRWDKMKFIEIFNYELPFWVLKNKDKSILGYIICAIFLDEIRIMNLCVKQAYQRLGYGEQLIRHALTSTGDVSWSILNVRVKNYKAVNLYLKVGYKILCCRENYYCDFDNESSYLMQLDLRHLQKNDYLC
jgi:ribosomal-protein-alanine N-acetyltransferase